jgi:hypothetical protein
MCAELLTYRISQPTQCNKLNIHLDWMIPIGDDNRNGDAVRQRVVCFPISTGKSVCGWGEESVYNKR